MFGLTFELVLTAATGMQVAPSQALAVASVIGITKLSVSELTQLEGFILSDSSMNGTFALGFLPCQLRYYCHNVRQATGMED